MYIFIFDECTQVWWSVWERKKTGSDKSPPDAGLMNTPPPHTHTRIHTSLHPYLADTLDSFQLYFTYRTAGIQFVYSNTVLHN